MTWRRILMAGLVIAAGIMMAHAPAKATSALNAAKIDKAIAMDKAAAATSDIQLVRRRGRYYYAFGLPFIAAPFFYGGYYSYDDGYYGYWNGYYGYPYSTYRYRRRGGYWHRRCVKSWGYGNANYYGCLRHHRRK